jgi:hypothetical protein
MEFVEVWVSFAQGEFGFLFLSLINSLPLIRLLEPKLEGSKISTM